MLLKRMPELKIIISDIDNTLIHPLDPKQDREDFLNKRLLEVDRGTYIDLDVIKSLNKIMDSEVPLILATSRRMATYKNISNYIHPLYAIVEDGCIILDKNGDIDKPWLIGLKEFIGSTDDSAENIHRHGVLWQFRAFLSKMENTGTFRVVDDGFMASFKIELPMDIDKFTADDIKKYLNNCGVEIPSYLKISINTKYDSISIIPQTAGKAQAANYLLEKLGLDLRNVAALGDDFNDEELLLSVGYPITLASAQDKIKNLITNRGGVVVSEGGRKGTKAMIDILIQNIEANSRKD